MTDSANCNRFAVSDYDVLRLLAINAYIAYMNANMAAAHAPAARQQLDRTRHPEPGDVVVETSTVYRWARHGVEAPRQQYPEIGILLRVALEPFPRDEDTEPDDGARETVYYIQPLDGSAPEYRWTNASFIRVLTSLDDDRMDSSIAGDREPALGRSAPEPQEP